MIRKIDLEVRHYGLSVLIILTDKSKDNISRILKEYNLNDYETNVDLYNTMLDDFDAEYDDDLSDMIEGIAKQLIGD